MRERKNEQNNRDYMWNRDMKEWKNEQNIKQSRFYLIFYKHTVLILKKTLFIVIFRK